MLRTAWKAFLERHPWDAQELRQLLEFAVEPSPKERALRSILDTKTLAWTVSRSVPALYLVHQVVHHVPALADRGGSVWFWDCHHFETLAINAVAARAFLDGRITARTLRAVFAIHGEYVFDLQFDVAAIDAKDLQRLSRAVHGKAARPAAVHVARRPSGRGGLSLDPRGGHEAVPRLRARGVGRQLAGAAARSRGGRRDGAEAAQGPQVPAASRLRGISQQPPRRWPAATCPASGTSNWK